MDVLSRARFAAAIAQLLVQPSSGGQSSAVGRISDGLIDNADTIVSVIQLLASYDSGGSNERDQHHRAGHRYDIMSANFLAGMLVGLLIGSFIGILAVALVAAGSEQQSPRSLGKRPKN
jgi:hypothetical protein